jgi:hypothetical protein
MSDYLWDKSGKDDEIEALEQSLSEFRSTQKSVIVPAKTAEVEPVSAWNIFRFAFGVPALAAVLLGFVFLWIPESFTTETPAGLVGLEQSPASARQKQNVGSASAPSESDTKDKGAAERSIDNVSLTKNQKPVRRKQYAAKRVAPRKVKAPLKIRPNKPILKPVRGIGNRGPEVASMPELNEEEKYAYAQLIKALSITSSKLKLVKDKIEGPKEMKSLR